MEINKIYEESCLETMKNMPDNFLDLTVTSPPYDNLRNYKDGLKDSWNINVWKPILEELYRVTKKGGVVVWNVGDATKNGSETGTSFKQALYFQKYGFKLHDTMIWAKSHYTPLTHNRYEQQHEYMFIFVKGKLKTFNPILIECKTAGTVWKSKSNKEAGSAMRSRKELGVTGKYKIKPNIWWYHPSNERGVKHPAIFPRELAEDHIFSWSNEGDLVYDPFMGSGTTGMMCKKNGRNFIGSDLSSDYIKISTDRINEMEYNPVKHPTR